MSLPAKGISLRNLMGLLGSRGRLALCMLLTVPFLLPISIPGSSLPFGLVIIIIGWGVVTDKPLRIPRRFAGRIIAKQYLLPILKKAIKIFTRIEKLAHPRLLMLTQGRLPSIINGLVMILGAILLMSPLPLPLSNALPAYGVLFLAAGNLEKDGFLIILGYVLVTLSLLYIGLLFFLGTEGLQAIFPLIL